MFKSIPFISVIPESIKLTSLATPKDNTDNNNNSGPSNKKLVFMINEHVTRVFLQWHYARGRQSAEFNIDIG